MTRLPAGRVVAVPVQRLVRRLGPRLGGDQPGEHVVDPVQQRSGAAEVRGELHRPADPVLGVQVGGDVGAAEPVDALLGVPDDEQPPRRDLHVAPVGSGGGRPAGDPHRDLDLDRVGVLELVQQQPLVALLQVRAHLGAVVRGGHQLAGQHQQVVELQPALLLPLAGPFDGGLGDAVGQPAQHLVEHLLPDRRGVGLDGDQGGPELGEVAARPVRRLAVGGLQLGGVTEDLEPGGRIGGGLESVSPLAELVQAIPEEVGVVHAVRLLGDQVLGRAQDSRHVDRRDGCQRGGQHRGVQTVPLRVERRRDRAQVLELDPGGQGQLDHRGQRSVLEDGRDQRRPAFGEGHLGGDLVEDLDQWRQAGLDRVLAEDPLREGVQGPDRGGVQVVQRLGGAFRAAVVAAGLGVADRGLERRAQLVPQLGGGLVGERHRRDLPQRDPTVGEDDRHHPVDQRLGLPGAGPGLDEQGVPEVGADRLAGRIVGQTLAPHASPPGSTEPGSTRAR